MEQIFLTNKQARRFILLKQGLIGGYRFSGKRGILEFIKQAGCIQFDPIDICGKNAELVLQARIKEFSKQKLYELLYKERSLIDYYDKNLAIIGVEDWIYFGRIRDYYRNHGRNKVEIDAVADQIKDFIWRNGPVCSKDIDFGQKIDWYWGNSTSLSRVALETMYFRGELIIHHKKGAIKYYDLAENYIPEQVLKAEEPNKDDIEYMKWNVLRRISAVGLLWNKPSDAWLFIRNMKSKERNQVFDELLREDKIIIITVQDIKEKFYCLKSDMGLLQLILSNPVLKRRMEFIAPLDNMIWDRRLIKAIFNYDYKWEIYTPQTERKYGYYVLPVLYGDTFIGRIELVNDRKNKCLQVKNIWLEEGSKPTKKLEENLKSAVNKFADFNGCHTIQYSIVL
ncbi:winged helix-turn-helix domain-containing protein [Anaerocolumna sedimenticola]|uniref:Winged helix-turn-helix domain-containing protein n=1 Tax=Anaerocolumna sedimenticola TaxID=2696063 RepID=A0A6P1TPM2_9FIRM|nr:crosslink repair DNA glycosylase YcaQ family protein [Anaerocolumna sedimenticola]QHQ62149.1 winged helix-turn-helix domain-containing protein [Anaerocolumna sedimenticola]